MCSGLNTTSDQGQRDPSDTDGGAISSAGLAPHQDVGKRCGCHLVTTEVMQPKDEVVTEDTKWRSGEKLGGGDILRALVGSFALTPSC